VQHITPIILIVTKFIDAASSLCSTAYDSNSDNENSKSTMKALIDACYILSYISDRSKEYLQELVAANVPDTCVQTLKFSGSFCKDSLQLIHTPILKCLCNIAGSGSANWKQQLIDSGVLSVMVPLITKYRLDSYKERTKRLLYYSCNLVAKLFASCTNSKQIDTMMHQPDGLMAAVIEVVATKVPKAVYNHELPEYNIFIEAQKEATQVISNITSSVCILPEQVEFLVKSGCLKPLCELLPTSYEHVHYNENDEDFAVLVLSTIADIMSFGSDTTSNDNGTNIYADIVQACGVVEKLKKLKSDNRFLQLTHLADQILGEFFAEEVQPKEATQDESFSYNGKQTATAFNFEE